MNRKYKSITHALNVLTRNSIRWCTPSIDFDAERVLDHHLSDMSVSYESLGFPSEPSGIFLDAVRKAAKAYHSDRTLFSVNGSTGGNFVVIRSLAKQIPNMRVLAQRNIHKSILNACQDYGVNLFFVNPNVDPDLQFFMPNSIDEIVSAVKETRPHVLLITNPTYEGLAIDLPKLIKKIRKLNPSLIVFVEEAWGSHLVFSKKLPTAAMDAGADICIQSTHKQGGALQQTGMIHWKEGRIHSELLLESSRNLMTTSPSYILLASLDSTREQMTKRGAKKIARSISIANYLSRRLDSIKGFQVISLKKLQQKDNSIFDKDATKVILDVSTSSYTGIDLAKLLEEKHNIIIEKYNANSLLFLVPFQATKEDVDKTISALKDIIKNSAIGTRKYLPIFSIPKNVPKILDYAEAVKLTLDQKEVIPLSMAKGRISGENITPYPPGIPTTIQGEQFTEEAIAYYETIRQYPNMHAVARDISLDTVLVVK